MIGVASKFVNAAVSINNMQANLVKLMELFTKHLLHREVK